MLSFRLATADDALTLGALATQVWLDTYAVAGIRPAMAEEVRRCFTAGAMQTTLNQPDTRIVVAEFNSHLVGFAQVRYRTPQALLVSAQTPAELERLYIQRPFLGQRVGALLLHEIEELAAQGGADEMWCSVWVHNVRALRFYEKRGYAKLGSSWYELDRERHENHVFSKRL
jgi:ribosomal protein S18 acetylase RimI-like enzyme